MTAISRYMALGVRQLEGKYLFVGSPSVYVPPAERPAAEAAIAAAGLPCVLVHLDQTVARRFYVGDRGANWRMPARAASLPPCAPMSALPALMAVTSLLCPAARVLQGRSVAHAPQCPRHLQHLGDGRHHRPRRRPTSARNAIGVHRHSAAARGRCGGGHRAIRGAARIAGATLRLVGAADVESH